MDNGQGNDFPALIFNFLLLAENDFSQIFVTYQAELLCLDGRMGGNFFGGGRPKTSTLNTK